MQNKKALFQSTKKQEFCPKCQSVLQIKRSKQGIFLGCSQYPKCDYLRALTHSNYQVIKQLNENCPECGGALQLKKGGYGIFIGCSHYPNCHFNVAREENVASKWLCPSCDKHYLTLRHNRLGRAFYGCEGYPHCKFILTSEPIEKSCPQCQCALAIIKRQKGKLFYQCVNKQCQYLFNEL